MAKLIKCKSCGNMVSKDASKCPQCGGKVKKSHGCLFFVVLVFLFIASLSMISGGSSGSSSERKEADPFQVEVFSESEAILFVQNFLEQKINSVVKAKLDFIGYPKVKKFSDVASKFSDMVKKNKDKLKTSINPENIWIITQNFKDKDNDKEVFEYFSLVEFAKGKGYRVIFLSVGDNVIFP